MSMKPHEQEADKNQSQSTRLPLPSAWGEWVDNLRNGPRSAFERFVSFLFKSWVVITLTAVIYSLSQGHYVAAASGVLTAVVAVIVLPALTLWFIYLAPETLRKVGHSLYQSEESLRSAILVLVPLWILVFVWILPFMIAIAFPRIAVMTANKILPSPMSLQTRIDYILGETPRYW